MEKVNSKNAPAAIGPYSQAILVGDFIYTSGQIPLDPVSGKVVGNEIKEQTAQVMKNLQAVLEEANTSFDNIIKTTCFLTNMNDFGEFNQVYGEYIIGKPARSCVAVKELPKGVLVEVEVIATVEV